MGKQPFSIDTIFENSPTIADYTLLKEDVKYFVDSLIKEGLKPNKVLRWKGKELSPKNDDLWLLEWKDIIELREAIEEKNMTEALMVMYQITEEEFLTLDVFNAFAVYKWIAEQLKSIGEVEKQELGGELTAEEKNAGVEELQEFGYYATLDALSKGKLWEHDKILTQPYAVIFRQLCLDKVKGNIQKNYIENVRRKIKAGG